MSKELTIEELRENPAGAVRRCLEVIDQISDERYKEETESQLCSIASKTVPIYAIEGMVDALTEIIKEDLNKFNVLKKKVTINYIKIKENIKEEIDELKNCLKKLEEKESKFSRLDYRFICHRYEADIKEREFKEAKNKLKIVDKLERYGIEYLSDNEKEYLTPYL